MKKNYLCLISRYLLILIEKIPNAMKLTFFFLVISLLTFTVKASAQKVSISFNNAKVEKVLSSISKQTGLSIAYSKQIVNLDRKVSIKVENANVNLVLEKLIADTNLNYEIKDNKIYLFEKESDGSTPVTTQKKKITGVVTDSNGETIIGANIIIKGTNIGTTTNIDGKFFLEVSPNDLLVVSYLGYESQTISVSNKTNFTIKLSEDQLALDEVIVVGYGVQQKANLSGAVAQLDSKELSNRPITNISSGIQGLMPGVTVTTSEGRPGQDNGSIRIRGVGTLNSSDPYVLIDGIESGSMNSIDPNDIESITVLKDASSAAIYGSKASNGVILITTKRGKTGKPQISYNGYVGIQNPTAMIDLLSSADYATLYNQALTAEGKNPRFDEKEIQKFRDGSDPYKYPNTDWQDLAFRTGVQHQHNVNISGGTDNIRYLASVGYLNQSGILRNSSRNQFNARTNLDIKLSEKLNVRMNMAYFNNTYSDPNSCIIPGNSNLLIREVNIVAPWIPYKNEDGSYGTVSDGNPIAWLDMDQTVDNNIQNFSGTVAVDYQIIDGLKASVQGAYITNNQHYKSFVKDIQYNPIKYHGPNELTETVYNWNRSNLDVLLNYDKKLNLHGLKVLLGYHLEKYNYYENTMFRKSFPNNDLTDMNAGTASTQTNGGFTRELAMLSYFGRINYDYDNKYLFEANIRADASSRFSPDNRWGYFPSLSAAWRLSEEDFMENTNEWMNNLKIRGSWGFLGTQNALNDYYPWMNTYSIGANYPFNNTLSTGYYQKNYRLASISWEKARTWGIGLDMTLMNKINFSMDYYDRKTTDIIMDVPVPSEFALGAYKDNVGAMVNRGIEIALGYNNRWKDWSLSVNGNFTYNRNEIMNLGGVQRMINGNDIKQIGSPINSYYAYKAVGFFQSDAEAQAYMDKYKGKEGYPFTSDFKAGDIIYSDTNGDGKMTSEDRVICGSKDPKFTYGLNINAGWRGFDLSAIFTGAAGVSRFFNTQMYGEFSGDTTHPSTAWLDAWSTENPDGKMPRVAVNSPSSSMNTVSTFWIQNANFLRMKSIQLGYTFPSEWIKPSGLSNLRIYYSGENLFTIDNLMINVDPEAPEGRGSHYPLVQTHSIGVNLTF